MEIVRKFSQIKEQLTKKGKPEATAETPLIVPMRPAVYGGHVRPSHEPGPEAKIDSGDEKPAGQSLQGATPGEQVKQQPEEIVEKPLSGPVPMPPAVFGGHKRPSREGSADGHHPKP
jgi:hypothetical protein